ncbi:MAG: hypothetical protein A3A43_03475 [Candidatus Liptonbacteria bacterium RIFCSPLOWO2_01_FULL_56_20]|uniref:AI-2E family transporter n=1 Tax=Candidatus Liptonbacteria bacterium RIFCSPLOWO2_01_FULL_56_20 TaxID=1798652 RepID=A0A1G2CJW6_9BACT|nr:MAG: hypothetical protein UY96_C0004G0028 [Parcubacteria group bacterium GW2011_GWB1_56_8]OGY97737.1 MAG: hypothetical protein A2681_02065 [Candidatus Liptonbacteria bacterium RIFCSPHIGHO2_01_FULL_56_18b]OGZ00951.1 MAG: hypothetical protein A3A43_03475 [Candidatus Liptonbacteria bacterium RIFCSPLOWO2_01_FULL_56_20]
MERKTLEISWASLWRVLFFIVLVALMFWGKRILLGLFLAIVISSGLEFIVNFLERRGIPRALGVIMVFLAGAVGIILTVYTIIPLIIVDINTALITLSQTTGGTWWGPLVNFRTAQSASTLINRISQEFFSGASSPLGVVSHVLGGVILSFSILISAFYLSLTRDGIERFIRAVFPPDYEDTALRIYANSSKRIGDWFRAQIVLSFAIALTVFIALFLLKVKYAFLLAILAGFFELVPYMGPILSGSAAVLSAFTTSVTLALYTLGVFLVIHQIEGHFLVPVIVGRHVALHPVIVIIALLLGFELGGILGMLISIPATVVSQEILEDWSGKRRRREPVGA